MQTKCSLVQQGYTTGSCITRVDGKKALACEVTLKERNGRISRLIESVHLSRPENYLSIYQSGCNFSCRKCHSWYFSKVASGTWYSPSEIAMLCVDYEKRVTLREPREKATAWHAHDSCRCCGGCVISGKRPSSCPGILSSRDIALSPQGFGPVRNIVGFTGGDLCCKPDFYAECARLIKEKTELWVLIETNGYGLTPENLDLLRGAGVDSFWLDIKAFDDETHTWLTGCSNRGILALPEEMLKRGFVLEVLSLYIPKVVQTPQLVEIGKFLSRLGSNTPFTILAFFPENQMKDYRHPTAQEMVEAFLEVKATGLERVRLGNTGVFAKGDEDYHLLEEKVGFGNY
ncbi:MAG: radical SAM protein [Syntrophobacterales bacterium]|nr:MAG: radical SAM protein [Syntrophobacterales bacterium]